VRAIGNINKNVPIKIAPTIVINSNRPGESDANDERIIRLQVQTNTKGWGSALAGPAYFKLPMHYCVRQEYCINVKLVMPA
jgi:hypothetical protein